MKRGKKLLLLLAVLVIAAGAALAAVRLFPDGEAVETAEEPETMILSLSSDELSSIGWTYEDETITFTKTDDGWEYAGDPAFPLSETSFGSVLSGVASVAATKTIEAPEDVSQYGLDEPACEVMVEPVEADTVWLRIGSETDMGGERYVSIGDGNVYLTDASILDAFSVGLYDLVQMESIPYMQDVDAFAVEGETQSLTIEHLPDSGLAYSDVYEWFAQDDSGSHITLDTELTEDIIESVTQMSWVGCVNYAADEEDLASYGLDTPAAVVTVRYTTEVQVATDLTDDSGNMLYDTEEREETFVLELGNYVDSYCYARIADSDMVYTVDASILDGLLYTDAASLRPDEVLAVDWSAVSAVDITLSDQMYTLTRELLPAETEDADTDEEDAAIEDVEITYETAWMLDGRQVAIEDALAELTSLTVEGYADGTTPERSEELRLVLHQQNETYPEIELVIYQYDSSACLAVRNGDTVTFVSRTDVTALIDALEGALSPEPEEESADTAEEGA